MKAVAATAAVAGSSEAARLKAVAVECWRRRRSMRAL
jgi:hypothetical protein